MELRIKEILKQRGIAILDLGKQIGLSRRTIFKRINNDDFTFDELKQIATFLNCSFYELMNPANGYGYIYDEGEKFRGVIRKIGVFDNKGNYKGAIK